jgi:hypothetical protein
MPDSNALRSRRKRLHAAGDCSLCRHRPASGVVTARAPRDTPEGPFDAEASLRAQARRLEAACEESPGDASLERVLKDTLLALRGAGNGGDGELDAFLAAIRG